MCTTFPPYKGRIYMLVQRGELLTNFSYNPEQDPHELLAQAISTLWDEYYPLLLGYLESRHEQANRAGLAIREHLKDTLHVSPHMGT